MAWLSDLAEHIEDKYSGYTVGTNVFIGFMPDSPDAAIAVYDAGGSPHTNGPEPPTEEHRAEVRIRATSYANAETMAAALEGYLHLKQNFTMNSATTVLWMRFDGDPALLEYDESNRAVFLGRLTMETRRSANWASS